MKGGIILLICYIGILANGQSQTHKWVRTNPGGGGAFSTIEAGPTGQIIAGSDLSGAYYSWDFGATWNVYGAERGLNVTHVSGIGFHPTDEDIFFIGTDGGIYKSINGGGALYEVLGDGYVTDIGVAPFNTQIVYATHHPAYDSADGRIYKSTDQGENWSQVSVDIPTGHRLLELHIASDDPNTVYVLSGNGRFACGPADLYRSTNGGINWTRLASSLGAIMDVAMHPTDPDSMYLTTMQVDCSEPLYYTSLAGDLYVSGNGGTTWTMRHADRTGVIWIKRDLPSTIRMIDPREPWPWVASGGTWKSTNSGASWTKISSGIWDTGYQFDVDSANAPVWSYGSSYNGFCKTLGESMAEPDVLLWTNSQWVFGTYDEGLTFQNLHTQPVNNATWQSTGFDNVVMNEIEVNRQNGDLIYVGFADLGLWRSGDRGKSWQSCNTPSFTGNWQGFGGNTLTVISDPVRTNIVWSGMQGDFNQTAYLVKSTSGGDKNSWVQADNGIPAVTRISGLSIDPKSSANSRTLYLTADGNVYKSGDDASNWSLIKSDGALHFTAVDQFHSDTIYAGGRNGIHRSLDGGVNWQDISQAFMKGSLVVDYWDFGYEGISSIATDPVNAGWVYVTVFGNSNGGVYQSTNAGGSWAPLYLNPNMRKIIVNPVDNKQLYAGSSSAYYAGSYQADSQGILYSDDQGVSWTIVNEFTPWPFATSLALDMNNPQRIYVGSPGSGIQYAYIGGSHCVHNQTLQGPTSDGTHQAVETIITQGTLAVQNNLQLEATQSIQLNPGFEVPLFKSLSINMVLCGQ